MSQVRRFPIAKSMRQFCAVINIKPEQILEKVGLSPDFLECEGKGVTAQEFFNIWEMACAGFETSGLMLKLGKALAQGPYVPAMLSFSCSPTVEIGLTRLALFKRLVAPVDLRIRRQGGTVIVTVGSSDPKAPMPRCMSEFELAYFLESARRFTGTKVVPMSVAMPAADEQCRDMVEHFGVQPEDASLATIVLSVEDAERPLVSENAEFWSMLENDMTRQMAEQDEPKTIAERVRSTLIDLLPSGESSIDAVCGRLNMSKRSLQRRLKAEEQTFQDVLESTRSELSMRYLAQGELSVEEISYLLAYRDPNSFYRAFHGWTGMTPMQAKGQVLQ